MRTKVKLQSCHVALQKALLVGSFATLSACGGGSGDGAAAGTSGLNGSTADAAYFPLAVGDRWVYRTWTDDNEDASSLELVKVAEELKVSGRDTKVLRTYGVGEGKEFDTQYLAVSSGAITVLADPTVSPGAFQLPTFDLVRFGMGAQADFQAIDQKLSTGYDSDGDGRSESIRIRVQIADLGSDAVQTDAGRFENCVHLKATISQLVIYTGNAPSYTVTTTVHSWYARGIGLVKEDVEIQRPDVPKEVFHQTLSKYNVAGVKSESVAPKAQLLKPNGLGAFSAVEINFDEDMDLSTLTAATVRLRDQNGKSYPLTMSQGANSVSFYPAAGPLLSGTYTAEVGGVGTDLVGNAIAAGRWSFDVDTTAPEVVSMTPAEGAKYVPPDQAISLTFTEDLNAASAMSNVSLIGPNGQVPAAMSVSGNRITIQPYSPLTQRQTYSVTINYDLQDKLGNRYGKFVTRSFQTEPSWFDYVVKPNGSVYPTSPEAVAIGDVNGDGRPDAVMANWFYFDDTVDYKLFVYHQGGDGLLKEPVLVSTQQTYTCRSSSVAIGDLNGDGRQDVVQAESGCGMEVFYQRADGQLESAGVLPSSDSYMVRLADVNRDGRLDMIGVGWGTNKVSVWTQQADGTMSAPQVYALSHAGWESFEVGDLNSDGRVDIVVGSGQGDPNKVVGILYQQANGSFGDAKYISSDSVSSVVIADFNGDGRNDVVVGRTYYSGVGVALQDASGKLGVMTTLLKDQSIALVRMADLDRDGRQELIALNGLGELSFYRPQADGSIQLYDRFSSLMASNPGPQSLELGDLNGDGYPDLVAKGLYYWLNRPQAVRATSSIASVSVSASGLPRASTAIQSKARRGRFDVWMDVRQLPSVLK